MTAEPKFDHVELEESGSRMEDLPYADSWAQSVTQDLERSNRRAWIMIMVLAAIAMLEGLALVCLMPLKTVEPYTLLVDRQTGHVEALAPLDVQSVEPDSALTRSFLVQYVIARESFSADSLQDDYRKVSLWSEGDAKSRYQRAMQASNPQSPLSYLSKRGQIRTEIKSVSSLGIDRSLVRFTTTRIDPGARPEPTQHWAAIVNYRFSGAAMSEDDRLINPLGFQVTRYRRDVETIPEEREVEGNAR